MSRTKNPLSKAIEKSMGRAAFALNQLMTRAKVPLFAGKKRVTLGAEEIMSIQFADELRKLSLEWQESGGKHGLRAVWCHVANERNASWFTMLLLRAQGMIAGAPDYWFIWEDGGALIELKTINTDTSQPQDHFFTWSNDLRVKSAVKRSIKSALEQLIEWGALIPNPLHVAKD